jgi:hypothetical protein
VENILRGVFKDMTDADILDYMARDRRHINLLDIVKQAFKFKSDGNTVRQRLGLHKDCMSIETFIRFFMQLPPQHKRFLALPVCRNQMTALQLMDKVAAAGNAYNSRNRDHDVSELELSSEDENESEHSDSDYVIKGDSEATESDEDARVLNQASARAERAKRRPQEKELAACNKERDLQREALKQRRVFAERRRADEATLARKKKAATLRAARMRECRWSRIEQRRLEQRRLEQRRLAQGNSSTSSSSIDEVEQGYSSTSSSSSDDDDRNVWDIVKAKLGNLGSSSGSSDVGILSKLSGKPKKDGTNVRSRTPKKKGIPDGAHLFSEAR